MDHHSIPWDLIILGGGAAGYFAASVFANASDAPKRILILEKARSPLNKVRISGGGRCNLTHACFEPEKLIANYPRGSAELRSAFMRFQPRDTMNWFEKHGVALKIESDGRIFPASDSSATIVNCLQDTIKNASVEIWLDTIVKKIELLPKERLNKFQIYLKRPTSDTVEFLTTRHILLATGGDPSGFSLAAGLGHSIQTPVPSLFTFMINDPRIEGLAGLSVAQVQLRLLPLNVHDKSAISPQEGPLLITHWGLSGPAVLRLSAWGARRLHEQNYQAALEVNWLFPMTPEQVLEELKQIKNASQNRRRKVLLHNTFTSIPTRLWQRLAGTIESGDAKNWSDMSKPELVHLAQELSQCRLILHGKGTFKEEFVTCGGVRLAEVDFKTMQSRLVPGLFFAGEILDIDGLTGGFNFQNAWTTAWIAGQALAKENL